MAITGGRPRRWRVVTGAAAGGDLLDDVRLAQKIVEGKGSL
ncbi:MAG TPA: hypothetical protein VIY52_17775 [Streptosporangiaceae bacterium]